TAAIRTMVIATRRSNGSWLAWLACRASSRWSSDPCAMSNSAWGTVRSGRCRCFIRAGRIEDADALPVGPVFVDEAAVLGGNLVGVVGGPVGEDEVEADVEVAVVDVAGQLGRPHPATEPADAGVRRQVLADRRQQLFARGRPGVVEAEIDVVDQLRGRAGGA